MPSLPNFLQAERSSISTSLALSFAYTWKLFCLLMLMVFICLVHQAKHQKAERKPKVLRLCFLNPTPPVPQTPAPPYLWDFWVGKGSPAAYKESCPRCVLRRSTSAQQWTATKASCWLLGQFFQLASRLWHFVPQDPRLAETLSKANWDISVHEGDIC